MFAETGCSTAPPAHAHALRYPAGGGDFIVDDRWLFEIVGPGETTRQMDGNDDAYVALDDIEHGRGRRVPFWMFGFLYCGRSQRLDLTT